MRYELTDFEWAAIKPTLPNRSRGEPLVNDRRVLNGIFWVLRSGRHGAIHRAASVDTTCYNRFARWRRAGIWCNRNDPICFSPYLYRARNLVERFFKNQALPARRNALRQTRGQLSRIRPACIHPPMAKRL